MLQLHEAYLVYCYALSQDAEQGATWEAKKQNVGRLLAAMRTAAAGGGSMPLHRLRGWSSFVRHRDGGSVLKAVHEFRAELHRVSGLHQLPPLNVVRQDARRLLRGGGAMTCLCAFLQECTERGADEEAPRKWRAVARILRLVAGSMERLLPTNLPQVLPLPPAPGGVRVHDMRAADFVQRVQAWLFRIIGKSRYAAHINHSLKSALSRADGDWVLTANHLMQYTPLKPVSQKKKRVRFAT